MGNTINVKRKGDKCREVTEEVIQDLGEQIRLVDDTMCGFAKTLDSLKAACELFLRQSDNKNKISNESQENDDGWEKVVADEELVVHLLKMLDDSVSNQKRSALESLAKMFHCLFEIGKGILDNLDENVIELSLDKYMTRQKQDENTKERLPYYEVRIEDLRKEVKIANELNKQCKDEIDILEEKNKLSKKEIDILRKAQAQMEENVKSLEEEKTHIEEQVKELESKLHEMNMKNEVFKKTISISETESTNITHLDEEFGREKSTPPISPAKNYEFKSLKNELESMKMAKQSLEAELNSLKGKQCIHVQMMNKASSFTPTEELLLKIKGDIETPSCRLYVIKQEYAADIKDDIPLLVFCQLSYGFQQSALRALENIKGLHRVALIVVHRDTKPSFIRASECVLRNDQFKKLSGIFDIVYDLQIGIHDCDLNKRNITGIVDFLQRKGVRISGLETYGLC